MIRCLDCAQLKRENERLQAEKARLERLIERTKEEIDLVAGEKPNGLRKD